MYIIVCIIGFIVLFVSLIIIDYLNIISNLGLSISFWTALLVNIFPIVLTLILWKKEEKDRIDQIREETNFQKKLIARSQYMSYYEDILEKLRNFKIFIKFFVINKNNKNSLDNAEELVRACIAYSDNQVWNIDYRIIPFKAIDIDIYKYNYNGHCISLREYYPYLETMNKLNSIVKGEEYGFKPNGIYLKKINKKEMIKLAKTIIEAKDRNVELYNFLEFLVNDIEKRIL